MTITIIGNEQSGQDIMFKLKQWDDALCSLDLNKMLDLYDAQTSFYDISYELDSLKEYQRLWQDFKPVNQTQEKSLKILRRGLVIYADEALVTLHALFKVEHLQGQHPKGFGWCRQTMCWVKKKQSWKLIHQHISIPVDLDTGIFRPMVMAR